MINSDLEREEPQALLSSKPLFIYPLNKKNFKPSCIIEALCEKFVKHDKVWKENIIPVENH